MQILFALFDPKITKMTKELIAKTKLSRNRISQNNLNKIRFSRFALGKHSLKRMAATSKLCRLKQCLLFLLTKLPGCYIAHEKFNLLPTGLASDQFVNHVVAISRQPAATPKRQPLKRKHRNMCLTPVRRSPRIAGTPLYEMDANLLR